jgi:hypothetical protein
MGDMMVERRGGEELSGLLSLGLLAEGAIRALGRVTRNEPLAEGDERILHDALRLFERMAEEEVVVVRAVADQMLTDDSYLDALRVVELAAGNDLQERAKRYAELLGRAVDGGVTDEERAELADLRDLFVSVGETTLSRANELSRAYPEPSWRPVLQTTSLF